MKNWSITKKLLVSPVIFTLALLILSWLSYGAIQSIRTTMDNLINVNSAKVIDAIDLQKSFGAMNGRMMRMIVWASTGLGDEESNKADIEALEGWLSTLQTKLETFKTSQTFNEEEQQSVDHIIEMAGHYFQASKDVIDAAKDDVTTAALFMFEVDDLYGKFNTAIGDQVTTWRTNATERFNQSHDEIDASITANATIVILILIVVFIITLFIAGGISKPVRAMTTAMQSLAKGQLDVQIPSEKRADEVGEMADALLIFKDNLVEMDQMRSAREVERKKQEDENRATMMDLADQLENAVSSIIITMGDKTGDILNVANAKGSDLSNNETSQSMEVAQASERTTTNADAVAGAIRELSGAISEIGQQVSQSTMIANEAVSKAQGANDKVTMLANAAQRIGEVVNLITDIAEQTNLLALNATIEAARAGEAGKGFAVVASEVKNLANQTANATDEIASQIAQIQGATEEAVEAIGDISTTINQIDQIAGTIAASVEEQDATTRDIAQNVQNVSKDAQAVADRIVNMTRNAARSHNTAIQVTWAAEDLKQPTDLLNSEVQGFLNRIRS